MTQTRIPSRRPDEESAALPARSLAHSILPSFVRQTERGRTTQQAEAAPGCRTEGSSSSSSTSSSLFNLLSAGEKSFAWPAAAATAAAAASAVLTHLLTHTRSGRIPGSLPLLPSHRSVGRWEGRKQGGAGRQKGAHCTALRDRRRRGGRGRLRSTSLSGDQTLLPVSLSPSPLPHMVAKCATSRRLSGSALCLPEIVAVQANPSVRPQDNKNIGLWHRRRSGSEWAFH